MLGSLLTGGCSTLVELNGGYVNTFGSQRGRGGAGFNFSAGAGDSSGGAGAHVRTKFAPDVKQVGVGAHAYVLSGGKLDVTWLPPFVRGIGAGAYARLGADLVQFAKVDDRFSFGTMSPLIDLGLLIPPLTLGTSLEYDLRLNSLPNDVYWGIFLGLGLGAKL